MGRLTVALRFLVICSLGSVSGCGVYFHSDAVQDQTEKIKQEFDALSLTGKVEDRLAGLKEMERQDDLLLAREMAARRDLVLLSILRPRQILADTPENQDAAWIDSFPGDTCVEEQRKQAEPAARLLVRINCLLDERLKQSWNWTIGTAPGVAATPPASTGPNATRADAADRYNLVSEAGAGAALHDISARKQAAAQIEAQRLWIRNLARFEILRSDLGTLPKNHPYLIAPSCQAARSKLTLQDGDKAIVVAGESFPVEVEIGQAWREMASACDAFDGAKTNLVDSLNFLICGNQTATDDFKKCADARAAARATDAVLDLNHLCGTIAESSLAHIADCLARAEGDLDKARALASAAESEVNRLALDEKSTGIKLSEALAKLKEAAAFSQEVAEAAGFDELTVILQDLALAEAAEVTSAASKPESDPARAARTQIAKSALSLIGAEAELLDRYGTEDAPVRLGALLIAKSQAEARRDLANLSVRQLQNKVSLREASLRAALTEIRLTAAAGEALLAATPPQAADAFGSSLGQLSQAYDVGSALFVQAELEEFQDITRYQVKRSAVGARAYQDAVAPAIAALEAYGKGGIDGNELAKILAQALGNAFIGGAILGS